MRPKIFAVLTVASLTLAGCSAAETEPAPTVAVTTTPEAEPAPASSASADPEQAFIDAVESQISGKEDALEAELPAKKMTEEYWLERGEVYCEQYEQDSLDSPRLKSALENQFEQAIMGASIGTLCPSI